MQPTQQAQVKSVLSGDTLVLRSQGYPAAERTVGLAFVSAPRLRREGDETFAVECRDYLRRLLVGKIVQLKVMYTSVTADRKRDYAVLFLRDGHMLPDAAVSDGFLKIRDDAEKKAEDDDGKDALGKLQIYQATARAENRGIWNTEVPRIQTSYELSDPQEAFQRWKGKSLESVVEKVLTGDRLIVRLIESPTRHVQTMLLLAGIRAPSTKRIGTSGNEEQPAEPFGQEAYEFVENRLLQRTVITQILGITPQKQLIGSVKHKMGDIVVFELQAGLARCNDYHSSLLGQSMTTLRMAEKQARDNQKGLFEGLQAPRPNAGKQSEVVVSRIQSADTLYLRYPDGREKRVNLSSIRQPKPSDPKQSPWSAEAKEFMRKRMIGKHVRVSIDGKRPGTEGYEEREMATVYHNNKNVALALVEAGYASVLRHKPDDSDRSPAYDDLMAAETTAQTEGKGMWSSKAPEAKQYVDYSESLDKAKRLFTLLSRQKRIPATVDYVKGGSRFTLLVPRENAKLTLVLSGIQAPRSARNENEASEPFGREAHDLANKRCQQRDVEVEVEDTDKSGGFIGKLYVNRENFAKVLLEEGFAKVRGYSAERSGNAAELLAAERQAKESRKGLWHDYDPAQDEEDDTAGLNGDSTEPTSKLNGDADLSQAPASKDYRDVIVTHVDQECRLKVQQISPSTTGALAKMMAAFRQFHISPTNTKSLTEAPKAGDIVAARFSEDGEWYRAKVRRNDREAKTAEVLFVDYGNSETRPWSELRPLGKTEFGVSQLRTQAQEAALSFVQFPSGSKEYMRDAQEALTERLSSIPQLVARVDHTDARDGTLWVTLFDPSEQSAGSKTSADESSINAEVVERGLGMVGRKLSRFEKAQKSIIEGLKVKEGQAKEERVGMWEYGDLTED